MSSASDDAGPISGLSEAAVGYQPGVCNIGPAEIAKRRRGGHLALIATTGLYAGLVLGKAPRPARIVVVLPAAAAASGYLQARLRFCAGFGSQGVYNFGEVGRTVAVVDTEAVAQDRARATQIGLASLAIGVSVGLLAVLVPR